MANTSQDRNNGCDTTAQKIVLSGCSGGGKSTLLDALNRCGFATIEEPGRRIVRQELAMGGAALPWSNPILFARRAVDLAREDLISVQGRDGRIFFDRCLVDAAVALDEAAGGSEGRRLCELYRYDGPVFLAPPWRALFQNDQERRHSFDEACAEYDRLGADYLDLGYDIIILPQSDPASRLAFILQTLDAR